MNASRPLKVLIVEDSAPVQERLVQLLAELGERVQVAGLAEDAPGAIALFEQQRPDAVILDLIMPKGSGLQVLEHIKQRRPACVVIVLTNYAAPPFRDRCRQIGADYFFSKSAEFEKVLEVLAKLANDPPPAPPPPIPHPSSTLPP